MQQHPLACVASRCIGGRARQSLKGVKESPACVPGLSPVSIHPSRPSDRRGWRRTMAGPRAGASAAARAALRYSNGAGSLVAASASTQEQDCLRPSAGQDQAQSTVQSGGLHGSGHPSMDGEGGSVHTQHGPCDTPAEGDTRALHNKLFINGRHVAASKYRDAGRTSCQQYAGTG
jgi:hypothetical protein